MPKLVTEEYSELMHYTTAAGLAGIVSTGCLWSTHAGFLNDAEEMKHFFDAKLLDIAFSEVRQYAEQLAKVPENARQMEIDGGLEKLAKDEAEGLVCRLRSATLAFNQPYIFSMSAARDLNTQSSGLLSQWRGYGGDGGYAIVFDTLQLEQLLELEAKTYHYQHFQWGDVHYYGADPSSQSSTEDVAESEEVVRIGIARLIRCGTAEETEGFYQALSSLSCLYKHWGFCEEREVRVVAIPVEAEVARLAAADGEAKPEKPIKTLVRGGLPVPYVELFAGISSDVPLRLPIKRVIVGPHKDANLRAQAVQRLLAANNYEAEVTCSKIPYLGR